MNDDTLLDEIRSLRGDTGAWASTPAGRRVMARAIALGEAAEAAEAAPSRPERPGIRRGGRVAVVGIGASALLVSGVAAATLAFQTADSPTQAGCYETLSAEADTTEASARLVSRVGPVEACAETMVRLGRGIDVSNLVSCVNPDGGRGVFPAPRGMVAADACGAIGWAVDAG